MEHWHNEGTYDEQHEHYAARDEEDRLQQNRSTEAAIDLLLLVLLSLLRVLRKNEKFPCSNQYQREFGAQERRHDRQ